MTRDPGSLGNRGLRGRQSRWGPGPSWRRGLRGAARRRLKQSRAAGALRTDPATPSPGPLPSPPGPPRAPAPSETSRPAPRQPLRRGRVLPARTRTFQTSQLTRTPGNSSPARGAEQGRRGEPPGRSGAQRGPGSASALACSGPWPGRPCRSRVILVSRGRTRRGPSLPAALPALLRRPTPAGGFQSRQPPPPPPLTRGRGAGVGAAWGRGGPRRDSGAARALWEGARQRRAHPTQGVGPAPPPDSKGAERAAEAAEGPSERGAPLPGREAGRRQGGAGLRWGSVSLAWPHRPLLTNQPHRRRGGGGSFAASSLGPRRGGPELSGTRQSRRRRATVGGRLRRRPGRSSCGGSAGTRRPRAAAARDAGISCAPGFRRVSPFSDVGS
ncbi:putative uncharacterized protein C1orf229 [Elephas maximus indicus]|uniref:putative uncharacterized protein C1orf229 n=1 Tax=Elephas maximus indicus TaxID=99487 RepID=UPI00211626E6|nr:putative uncharacterized protein C1orf229 [Elephas maximus indicus]XP_049750335.1 putative uncharacterized protein C1orf229 [Elephas maximus indicus]XP_049750336.1 putative uncharacterized protein C1orf229 [Elephas maximus indicus]XP_049750337.1 putative uncharacterized protein C1orf229 [Elephas maximus indicus]XP_049750338.1 putative uncharacterized protein C1orf229 [Elephas maximus indicus]XP_049750339.1 putative uncharacterized protein C1orf229 [Elephas maximus indicus]